jgi:diguanylate cyclase (GGDEF)-like protein
MRILIAEDDRVSNRMLAVNLERWGHDVVATMNGAEALEQLQAPDAPRLAIVDWMMPEMDGLQLCQTLRDDENGVFRYLIMLTSRTEKGDAVAALDGGADDYLTKPYDMAELRARVNVGVRIIDLQMKLEEANRKLAHTARTDELTQTLNRKAIMDFLGEELARNERRREGLVVLMADIDYFKRINDTYGHVCGDRVLREVADRLKSACRAYDHVGRYGGEEFLVVLGGPPPDAVEVIGERFLSRVNGTPVGTDFGAIEVTASFGIIWVPPVARTTPDAVLHAVDALLYEAKSRGRNRYVSAGPEGAPYPTGAAPTQHGAVDEAGG